MNSQVQRVMTVHAHVLYYEGNDLVVVEPEVSVTIHTGAMIISCCVFLQCDITQEDHDGFWKWRGK